MLNVIKMAERFSSALKLVICIFSLAVCEPDPPGHMKPLGHHMPPLDTPVEILHQFPTPENFYEKYMKTGKPILFKGILESEIQPAYKLWTDEYLREAFGDEMVDVEEVKKENRYKKVTEMPLSEFLDMYKTNEVYMVHDAPDSMKAEVNIPRSLLCGGFQNLLQNLYLWLSSGGTKSVLHHDSYENFICMLDGGKYFMLIDKVHAETIEASDWDDKLGHSNVDVEKVDMYKFPNLRNFPWYEVTINKGDCLYVPFNWYHYVESKPGRNFGINVWFNKLLWFNHTDCENVDQAKLEPKPATEFNFSYGAYDTRQALLAIFEGLKVITEKEFLEAMKVYSSNEVEKEEIIKLFHFIDANGDGQMSPEECLSFDVQVATNLHFSLIKYIRESIDDLQPEDTDSGNIDNTDDTHQISKEEKDEMDTVGDQLHKNKKLHLEDEL